jgi:hypothetical protein
MAVSALVRGISVPRFVYFVRATNHVGSSLYVARKPPADNPALPPRPTRARMLAVHIDMREPCRARVRASRLQSQGPNR